MALFGALCLLLAAHPFTTYPLSLRLMRRAPPLHLSDAPGQRRVALCVCAYNEERVIRAKVENMLAIRKGLPALEILVYVDAASDRTFEILSEFGDQLRVVLSPLRQGKTHGMNTLIGLTDAELLVFSDANVMFGPDAVPHLLAPFADPSVGVTCGHLVYLTRDGSATAETGSLYWRLEEAIKALESATGSVMGADGSIFALRRSLHEAPPVDLIDDMYVSLAVLCGGARVVRVDGAYAYEESVSRHDEEFRRKVRIACQAYNVHRTLSPRLRRLPALDRYKYLSHKLLRWFTIYTLAVGTCCLLAGLALAGAWPLALGLFACGTITLAVVAIRPRGKLGMIYNMLGAFLATGIGVARSLRGERFQTWRPAASLRSDDPVRFWQPGLDSDSDTRPVALQEKADT